SARVTSAKSVETAPPRCTPRNFRASASKRIFSPRPTAPASKPSFSLTTPASAPSCGGATMALPCSSKSSNATASSTPAPSTTPPPAPPLPAPAPAPAAQPPAWARAAGVPVIADLDELYPGVEALLPNVDYLITSCDIPGKLAAIDDLQKSLPGVHRRFGCRLTAVTLGIDGVLAWDGAQFHYAPAFHVDTVDIIGVGDLFHA